MGGEGSKRERREGRKQKLGKEKKGRDEEKAEDA